MSGWGRTSGSAGADYGPRESIGLVAAFCLGVRAGRQAHRKDRTLAGLARHRNVATHHACELVRERKARSRSWSWSWRMSTSERDIPPSAPPTSVLAVG